MAYDGITWNEAGIDNNTQASLIDDHMRDLMKAVRSRMAQEHVFPASQTGTNEAGWHTFITMSAQTSTPSLVYGTSTQEGCVFIDANNHLTFEASAGTTYIICRSGAGIALAAGTGTLGAIPYITSGGGTVLLAPATSGYMLVTASNTGAPVWQAFSSMNVARGVVNNGGIIPLTAGYSSASAVCFVSVNNIGTSSGGDGDNIEYLQCAVDANRQVTCRAYIRNGFYVTGTANYMIVCTR